MEDYNKLSFVVRKPSATRETPEVSPEVMKLMGGRWNTNLRSSKSEDPEGSAKAFQGWIFNKKRHSTIVYMYLTFLGLKKMRKIALGLLASSLVVCIVRILA